MGANRGRTIAVIGGGIAGLAAATAFARSGAQVTVYEQSDSLREIGAGLQVTPNGARVLSAFGLDAAADLTSLHAAAVVPRDALTGRQIARFDLGRLPGPAYRFFHRADLLHLLAQAAQDSGVTIKTGYRADRFDDTEVAFSNGQTTTADLVVGAEGLHSALRADLNGADAPFFTGQVAWRSVIDMADAPAEATIWMAPGRHVVTYPLPGGRLNIVAIQERETWAAEGWSFFDQPSVVQAVFADCAPALQRALSKIHTVRLWGLFRHPVAAKWWGQGRVILGDAAHPTLPFLAQGANLALEDAFVLSRACDAHLDLAQALDRYQKLREGRVIRAISAANANARNYHLGGARKVLAHSGLRVIGRLAPAAFLARMDWLYGYDARLVEG